MVQSAYILLAGALGLQAAIGLNGGLTEYLSMVFGLQALIYFAAGFYALAYLTGGRHRAATARAS